MNKKQAYKMVMYLLDEAYGLLHYADYTDVKAIANLLGTANYIAKSYNLREREQIVNRIRSIRSEADEYLNVVNEALGTIFL